VWPWYQCVPGGHARKRSVIARPPGTELCEIMSAPSKYGVPSMCTPWKCTLAASLGSSLRSVTCTTPPTGATIVGPCTLPFTSTHPSRV
jgi:hypothetical protein